MGGGQACRELDLHLLIEVRWPEIKQQTHFFQHGTSISIPWLAGCAFCNRGLSVHYTACKCRRYSSHSRWILKSDNQFFKPSQQWWVYQDEVIKKINKCMWKFLSPPPPNHLFSFQFQYAVLAWHYLLLAPHKAKQSEVSMCNPLMTVKSSHEALTCCGRWRQQRPLAWTLDSWTCQRSPAQPNTIIS